MVIRLLRGTINAGNIELLLIEAEGKKAIMASLSVFRKCCEQGQVAVNELWLNGALSCILQVSLSSDQYRVTTESRLPVSRPHYSSSVCFLCVRTSTLLSPLQRLSNDPSSSGDYDEDVLNASLACLRSFIEHDESSRSWWTLTEDKLDSIVRNCLWPFQSKKRESSGHKESTLFCEYAIMILWSLVEKSGQNEQSCGQTSVVDVRTRINTCKVVKI